MVSEARVELWPIDKLVFYARNPRKNEAPIPNDRMSTDSTVKPGLCQRVRRASERSCRREPIGPIIVQRVLVDPADDTGEAVDGHGRAVGDALGGVWDPEHHRNPGQ
jgi:hypothetical protein